MSIYVHTALFIVGYMLSLSMLFHYKDTASFKQVYSMHYISLVAIEFASVMRFFYAWFMHKTPSLC